MRSRGGGLSVYQFQKVNLSMKIIPTPYLSVKVATALDVVGSLLIEQIGFVYQIPFYHPVILSTAVGLTFVLFKWKDEITVKLLDLSAPLQNKNLYNYYDKFLINKLKLRIKMLQGLFDKKRKKRQKEVYLFFAHEGMN